MAGRNVEFAFPLFTLQNDQVCVLLTNAYGSIVAGVKNLNTYPLTVHWSCKLANRKAEEASLVCGQTDTLEPHQSATRQLCFAVRNADQIYNGQKSKMLELNYYIRIQDEQNETSLTPNVLDLTNEITWKLRGLNLASPLVITSRPFTAAGNTWRILLFPKGEQGTSYAMEAILESLTDAEGNLELEVAVQQNNGQSQHCIRKREMCTIGSGNRLCKLSNFAPVGVYASWYYGFLHSGWLIIQFTLIFSKITSPLQLESSDPTEESSSGTPQGTRISPFLENRMVYIDVYTDEIMKRHSGTGFPLCMRSKRDSRMYLLNEHESISSLNKRILADVGMKSIYIRPWICIRNTDGSITLGPCLQDPDAVDATLADYCNDDFSAVCSNDHPSLTIYLEMDQHEPLLPIKATVMIFCNYFDPETEELRYLGCISLKKTTQCVSILEHLHGIGKGHCDEGTCSLFMESGRKFSEISPAMMSQSVCNIGLKSGTVILLVPKIGSRMPPIKMLKETFGKWKPQIIPIKDAPATPALENMGGKEKCLVCLVKPRSSGFLHGTASHKCVCKYCAEKIMGMAKPLCPVCRASVDRVIHSYFQ